MADVLTAEQRSRNMSMIRSGYTEPEMRMRDMLSDNGFRPFVMHPKDVPGRPDFYFPEHRAAVFLDGCFWHGCKECYQTPATRTQFWSAKIAANLSRDRSVDRQLRTDGISSFRVKEHELRHDPSRVLSRLSSLAPPKRSPKVLDLFAGAGGFSEGFASAGCDIVAHIEMDKAACDTLRTRMMYHALRKAGKLREYKKYVLGKIDRETLVRENDLQKEYDSVIHAKISQTNYRDLIREVRRRLNGEKLDVIIGGPPCQAYSHIGRSSDKKRMKRDQRKFLYEYYVAFLRALRPSVFVFENVPGLLSAGRGMYLRDMRRLMKRAGYSTDYRILNAADFGVPQERKRVFLIGWRKDAGIDEYPSFQAVERSYGVKDFLDDLPPLKPGEGVSRLRYKGRSSLLRRLGITSRSFSLVLDHLARPQSARDLEIYRIAVKIKNRGKNLRYNELPPRLKTYKNTTSFLDRFRVVDISGRASHTVIAHIANDGHYYIHPDLKQNRALTVREAARLQTFPDDFVFEGTRSAQFRQIGNAVPPMLSKLIARELLRHLG